MSVLIQARRADSAGSWWVTSQVVQGVYRVCHEASRRVGHRDELTSLSEPWADRRARNWFSLGVSEPDDISFFLSHHPLLIMGIKTIVNFAWFHAVRFIECQDS